MPPRTREEELWDELIDEAGEELIEAASRVTVEQAEKELTAAGFDVAEERARAEAFLASLVGVASAQPATAPAAKVLPMKPGKAAQKKKVPVVVWAVAAAVATGGAGVGIYAATRPDKPTPPTPAPLPEPTRTPPRSPELVGADALRQRAADALHDGHPDQCLSLLDQARAKDPAGDETDDAKMLRAMAMRQLEVKP